MITHAALVPLPIAIPVPWQKHELYQRVSAATWLVCSHKTIRPYKFAYAPHDNSETTEPDAEKNPELTKFLQAFRDRLQMHKLVNVFGLYCYLGNDFPGRTEIRRGRARFNLLPTDARTLFQRGLDKLTSVHRSHQI